MTEPKIQPQTIPAMQGGTLAFARAENPNATFPPSVPPGAFPRVPLPWFGVRRLGPDAKVALKGAIGQYGPPVTELLRQIGDAQNIELCIDVTGGETRAMFSILEATAGRLNLGTIFGTAQSAGAVIAIACKHLRMKQTATMLLHRGKFMAFGDADFLLKAAEVARQTDERIAKIISARTGRDASEYMDGKDHWFKSAAAAKAANLIDEIIP